MGTNKCASQSGMTAYGTRRHLYDPKNQILPPMDHSTISLQMGTNKCASQVKTRYFELLLLGGLFLETLVDLLNFGACLGQLMSRG